MSTNPVARPQSRRAFIGALAALPAGAAVASTVTPSPDTVFALIAQEQAAWIALEEASCIEGCQDTPGWNEKDVAQLEALDRVCSATPTTPEGLIAMMDLFSTRSRNWISDPWESQINSIFAAAKKLLTA